MLRYKPTMTPTDLSNFVATLPERQFTHKDVMRCYSIYMRNEFSRTKANPEKRDKLARGIVPSPKKQRKNWTDTEISTLKSAVEVLGKGNWTRILELHSDVFSINNRKARDLQKKWTQLEKEITAPADPESDDLSSSDIPNTGGVDPGIDDDSDSD